MARALDITVVVAPPLRNAFEGRSVLSLGLPAEADLGDVVETLLRLYPRTRSFMAGDRGTPGGRYMHLVLDGGAEAQEGVQGRGGLAAGHKIFVFALSRPTPSNQPDLEG
ncbi:hypothetical protein [Hyalangium versicolor]|uniref:hypothetical protein n=1 Tax=Hyalangium versicolor TaxID=2861190 RepID=UPI001CCFF34B|nr:hypothetical protein [Hyalangium versicolor]